MPGLSINRAPPGIRKSSRCVVVWRLRSSLCRTSRVGCTFSSSRRLMSVEFPTPDEPTSTAVSRGQKPTYFSEAEPVELTDAARHQYRGAYRDFLDLGPPRVDRFRKIGFFEKHRGHGATLPDGGQVALDPSRVEIFVEPHDDDDGDDLLDGPSTGDLPRKSRAARQHRLDSGVAKSDPIADRGQVRCGCRLVSQASGNTRLVLAVFRYEAMGLAA